ncbi:MAG: hypothetical protein JSV52_06225 [Candidatus Zixiibacteriota bacterium]|nr:MAG: hypothetical protein JSV52_06225 [candidate division Zixibacteria bacterium]
MKRQIPVILVGMFGLFMIFQYFVPHESSEWVYEFLLDWTIIIGIFAMALGLWSLYRVSVEKIKTRKPAWGYNYLTLCGLFTMMFFGFTTQNGEAWGWFFPFLVSANLVLVLMIQASVNKGGRGLFLGLAGVFLVACVVIIVFDNTWGFHFETAQGLQSTMFRAFFDHILIPIFATMFSLLAFFIASAAYRAFRARNVMATLLLLAALIVMLRFHPFYGPLTPYIAPFMSKTSNWLMNVPNLAAQRAIIIGVGLGIVATALKVILGIERGYMGKG